MGPERRTHGSGRRRRQAPQRRRSPSRHVRGIHVDSTACGRKSGPGYRCPSWLSFIVNDSVHRGRTLVLPPGVWATLPYGIVEVKYNPGCDHANGEERRRAHPDRDERDRPPTEAVAADDGGRPSSPRWPLLTLA